MAELPTEIIAEILSRLPVKSLLRYQVVCKSWNSLIKTHNFIKIHLNQTLISNSDHHLLLSSIKTLQWSELDLRHNHLSFSELNHPIKPHEGLQLIGSCNGVVCISTFSKTEVFLYNPLTKSHRKLPSNPIPVPDLTTMLLGFGNDSKNNDYKILRVAQGLGLLDSKNKAQVYSFNDNSWRCIEGMPYYLYYGYYHGVLVNEALHYVVTQESFSEYLFIARFDLATESFSLIEFPNYDKPKDMFNLTFLLIELGGCLCLLINSYPDVVDGDLLDELDNRVLQNVILWVMEEYGNKESWVKLFCISLPETIGLRKFIGALVYSKDGRRILLQIDSLEYGWYDLESEHVERITAHGLPSDVFTAMTFIGSLVSLGDKMVSERKTLLRENKKKTVVDNFLSTGFKLRL